MRAILGGLAVVVAVIAANAAFAEGLNETEYSDRFSLFDSSSADWPNIEQCFAAWGKHPFDKNSKFRTIASRVSVFGAGNDIVDDVVTTYPQLVFINSTVNVMGKTTFNLKNPNGWYCLEANVNVMGKVVINAACDAHIATTKGNTVVMGKSDASSGTTVMGKSVVNRDCK
jgi:hypothetical protein